MKSTRQLGILDSPEMQPRGAPSDIRQLISQRFGPLADRAKALYGVCGAPHLLAGCLIR